MGSYRGEAGSGRGCCLRTRSAGQAGSQPSGISRTTAWPARRLKGHFQSAERRPMGRTTASRGAEQARGQLTTLHYRGSRDRGSGRR